MYRNILFRGKAMRTQRYISLKKGEWIYGSLIQLKDGRCYIHTEKWGKDYQVMPETIGQYIGIDDVKGNKIFEGDIDSDGFVFQYSKPHCRFQREKNFEGLQFHPTCFVNGGKFPTAIKSNIHE